MKSLFRILKLVSLMAIFFFLPSRWWPDHRLRNDEDYQSARGGYWEMVDDGWRHHESRWDEDGNDKNPDAVWMMVSGDSIASLLVDLRKPIAWTVFGVEVVFLLGVAVGKWVL